MKAIIFDLGNVLVNYDGNDTFTAVSELTGASLETLFAHYQTIDYSFGTGQLSGKAYYKLLDQQFGIAADYDQFARAICRNQARNEQGLAFARKLQAQPNAAVGIISNTNEIHAGWLHTNLPELTLFPSVILSNEVGLLKPDPAIYQLALHQLGVAPDQAMFVDDVAENVAGGTAVGLAAHLHTNWHTTTKIIEEWLLK